MYTVDAEHVELHMLNVRNRAKFLVPHTLSQRVQATSGDQDGSHGEH